MAEKITFTINGKLITVEVDPARPLLDVLREYVRSGSDVECHCDHGALAGHFEDGVGQVCWFGADLIDRIAVFVVFLPAQILRSGVELGLADHSAPLVFLFAGRAFADAFAESNTGHLVTTNTSDPVARYTWAGQIFNSVFLRNPEGHTKHFSTRLV